MGTNTFVIVKDTTCEGRSVQTLPSALDSCIASTSVHEGMDKCDWTCCPSIASRKLGKNYVKYVFQKLGQQAMQDSDAQRKIKRRNSMRRSQEECAHPLS